jgi:hypothetical protein
MVECTDRGFAERLGGRRRTVMRNVLPIVGRMLPVLVAAGGVACGDAGGPVSPPANALGEGPPQAVGGEFSDVVAEFEGHWDAAARKLTFTPVDRGGATLQPEGFAEIASGNIKFTTDWAVIGASAAPHPCTDGHLCASVTIRNLTARQLYTVWVENYGTKPSGYEADNSDTVPAGYPVSTTDGAWNYGQLMTNWTATKIWKFKLPGSDNFTFQTRVKVTFLRSSYSTASGTIAAANNVHGATWSDSAPVWIDACALASHSQILTNQPYTGYAYIPVNFPLTVYTKTFSLSDGKLTVSVNGGTGYSALNCANSTLPASGRAYVLPAFWDDIATGADGICYATTGVSPDRYLIVTWKNVHLTGYPDTRLSFSTVHRETTDEVWYLYNRWSGTSADCDSESVPALANTLRGGSATVGVQLTSSTAYTQFSGNTAFLPAHPATCPGDGFWVKLIPAKANNVF